MVASACNAGDVAEADRDRPCFPVSPDDSSRNVGEDRADCTDRPLDRDESPSEVEIALAAALSRAADAGRFDVVMLLAREIEGRRLARTSNMVGREDQGKAC
jgi:hypothetical protein